MLGSIHNFHADIGNVSQGVLALERQHQAHEVLDRLCLHSDLKFVIAVENSLVDRVRQLALPEWTILAVHECEDALIGEEHSLIR